MASNLKKYLRRKNRVKAQIKSSTEKPRLSVFRSNKHIYAQLIDDKSGKTIVAFNDNKISLGKGKTRSAKTASSESVGKVLGEEILKKGYNSIVFDRNGYRYHGRVKALAMGLRSAGLKF